MDRRGEIDVVCSLVLLVFIFIPLPLFSAAEGISGRLVFCHYMLWAPLFSDDVVGFKNEILLAQSYGIDAFALNTMVWNDEYQRRASQIYEAARDLGTGFKLFFSADLDTGTQLAAEDLVSMIKNYSAHPNQLAYRGKQFFSSFTGNNFTSDPVAFWRDDVLKTAGNNTFFLPFFVTDGTEQSITAELNRFSSVLDGLFSWDLSAWAYNSTQYNAPSNSSDQAYMDACGKAGKIYMASVSPWFFAHTANCSCLNCSCVTNQVKGNYQGSGLWIDRWNQLVQSSIPLVEILTWNNWAERHYVTPVGTSWGPVDSGTTPPLWNDTDFSHQAFLDLGSHFIQWYKTGQEPIITSETLYLFYYTHSKNAVADDDPVGKVQNADFLSDRLYATVKLMKAGATVRLTSGDSFTDFTNITAGIHTVSIPLRAGQQAAKLIRNQIEVLSVIGDLNVTNNNFSRYDFNVFTKYVPSSSLGPFSVFPQSKSHSLSGTRKVIVIVVATIAGTVGIIFMLAFVRKRILRKTETAKRAFGDEIWTSRAITMAHPTPMKFHYKELKAATDNFKHKLGEGGFGSVYKGVLSDQSVVAVKKLEKSAQGDKEFIAEVLTIGSIHHANLVRLYGYCSQGQKHRLLVYEYLEKGSLDRYLFAPSGTSIVIDWKTRFRIALGIAKGIAYFHEQCRTRIVHCDIKPENVLLDADFSPKLSDFGLAKLLAKDQSATVTNFRGTRGYLAPEWIANLPITEKADVYSYGMMLLEIVGGRKNLRASPDGAEEERYYPTWAYTHLTEATSEKVVDEKLQGEYALKEAEVMLRVAFWCIQDEAGSRPSMGRVVDMLEGGTETPMPGRPRNLGGGYDL
eukprot:c24283_g1_i1 orf=391-2940(-)